MAFSHMELEIAILRAIDMRICWLNLDSKRNILTQLADHGQAVIPSPRVPVARGCPYDPLQILLEVFQAYPNRLEQQRPAVLQRRDQNG